MCADDRDGVTERLAAPLPETDAVFKWGGMIAKLGGG